MEKPVNNFWQEAATFYLKQRIDGLQIKGPELKFFFICILSLEKSYNLTMQLRYIYHTVKEKVVAFTRLAHWHEQIEQAGFKQFNTVKRSISAHYQTIINYFENRSTNASAESFNAKIKAFRTQFRGVRDIPFFIFRLTEIFA